MIERRVDGAQTRSYEVDNQVRLLESQIAHHLERLESLRDAERKMERELGEMDGQRGAFRQERGLLEASLSDLESKEREADAVLERETTELDRRRGAAEEAERAVGAIRQKLGEAETRMARAEALRQSFERPARPDRQRREKLSADKEALARLLVEKEQELSALGGRLNGLRGGRSETSAKKEEIEAELAKLRDERKESDSVVEAAREELVQKRSPAALARGDPGSASRAWARACGR